jgi:hypothetical protein
MKHIFTPILLLAAVGVVPLFQGCEKKDARPAATPPVAAPAAAETTTPEAPKPTSEVPTPVSEAPKSAGEAPKPASEAPKLVTEVKPVRIAATSADDFDPATDPVLGWWKGTADPFDEKKVSVLWPTDADDVRALRTIRFLNDSMATNGCCAGAEWGFVAPKFYKVDREIHELYYLPDDGTLYFLARVEAKGSAEVFQKIVTAINAGKSVDELAKSKLIEAPAKFARFQPR